MYLETGLLSTLEYLYVLRWERASSVRHSAAATSAGCQYILRCRDGEVVLVRTFAAGRHDGGGFLGGDGLSMGCCMREGFVQRVEELDIW